MIVHVCVQHWREIKKYLIRMKITHVWTGWLIALLLHIFEYPLPTVPIQERNWKKIDEHVHSFSEGDFLLPPDWASLGELLVSSSSQYSINLKPFLQMRWFSYRCCLKAPYSSHCHQRICRCRCCGCCCRRSILSSSDIIVYKFGHGLRSLLPFRSITILLMDLWCIMYMYYYSFAMANQEFWAQTRTAPHTVCHTHLNIY